MRSLVVGDIHGSFRSLLDVLEKSNFDNSVDRLIILGDYSDRWFQTYETVDYLINLQKESGKHIFLKGNHDVWVSEWLNGSKASETWLMNGGISTIESYKNNDFKNLEEHTEFFNNLLNYYIDNKSNAFVHAGYQSSIGLEDRLMHQDYIWDRLFFTRVMNGKIGDRTAMYNKVFIGHTTTLSYKVEVPIHRKNVWNIDTGCGFNGRLTIMDVDTNEYWQSEKSDIINKNPT